MKCYPHARDIYTIIFAGWFNKANCKCDIGIKKNLIKISKNTELYYQPFFFFNRLPPQIESVQISQECRIVLVA